MTQKRISQIVGEDGKPAAAATSAPGCFIHDGEELPGFAKFDWGPAFSEPTTGNNVEFYVTGESYFAAVVAAIAAAKESIFITGWQVNFDAELVTGKTLYECLEQAIDAKPNLHVYVMPWLSPKVGVDTGDFETTLAVFQLNAGLKSPRAFALPAIAQSDMEGGLAIGFSHHQKLVVIDQARAFVGGIDLAYGRRDDGRFALAHGWRKGNELYNTCIPAVHSLSHVEQTQFLTRAEILAACFDGKFGSVLQFATSAPIPAIARVADAMGAVGEARADAAATVSNWWNNLDLMPEFVKRAADMPVDAAQGASRWAYGQLDSNVREMVTRLRASGAANAADYASALIAWLNNGDLGKLPEDLRAGTVDAIQAFVMTLLSYLASNAQTRKVRYANIRKLRRMLPASGKVLDTTQPRMPWHDVHCSVRGASVADLARNFVLRWNGVALRYENSQNAVASNAAVKAIISALGLQGRPRLKVPRLTVKPAQAASGGGNCWVQVLRSAPKRLQQDELAAAGGRAGTRVAQAQNNCLKAMLKAIAGSQKFLYIEGQFFQSRYDEDFTASKQMSGPLAALLNITRSANYEKHARRLGIHGIPAADIPGAIRWSQVDDVMADIKGGGDDFMNDLYATLGNLAAVQASRLMGPQQAAIRNRIGDAIATRIERAIYDGLPYHVYLVIPAHPEGTLNTLNIMTQQHLTMQSLAFGQNSLLMRVRRAIAAHDLMVADRKLTRAEALKRVAGYRPELLVARVADRWKDHLTLLNLRNWAALDGRPVTEQIYVHSKLLIADDRVAILGSANINDRSQLGDRDSELAVIVRDNNTAQVKLNGSKSEPVSAVVHDLRVRLWKKLFGLDGGSAPATALSAILLEPASAKAYRQIQQVAEQNLVGYDNAFAFLPSPRHPSSIWPVWDAAKRKLTYHMPFSERFWRKDAVRDEHFSWEAEGRATERTPQGVKGYIVALPILWMAGENNISGMNLTLLANRERERSGEGEYASTTDTQERTYENV